MSETTTETVTIELNDLNTATILVGLLARIAFQEKQTKALEEKHKSLADVDRSRSSLDSQLEDIEGKIDDLESKIEDVPDVQGLENRLDDLENQVGEIESNVDNFDIRDSSPFNDLESKVEELESKQQEAGSLADLSTKFTNHAAMANLALTKLDERLANIEGTLQRIKEAIQLV